jgi:hypothetical protein
MRYITLVTPSNRRLMVIDRVRPILTELIDAAYYADKFQCSAVLSNYKNIFDASRVDLVGAKRLEGEALLTFLEDVQSKARGKRKRRMHPASLSNLRSCQPFASGRSTCKPRQIHDQQVEEAKQLRAEGRSWRAVGDALGLNASSIRSALTQRGTKASNSPEYSG